MVYGQGEVRIARVVSVQLHANIPGIRDNRNNVVLSERGSVVVRLHIVDYYNVLTRHLEDGLPDCNAYGLP